MLCLVRPMTKYHRLLILDSHIHFSRFHPQYKLVHLPATPVEVLEQAKEIALQSGLHYVYIGNVPGGGDKTVCPDCKRSVVTRRGYTLLSVDIKNGRCPSCNTVIGGRWET